MTKESINIEVIKKKLRDFSKERNWEQYHSPKNLVMALSVEVAELVEIFQWSNEGGLDVIEDADQKIKIEKEIADIFNYLVKLIDMLDIDIEEVSLNKIKENAKKYPIDKVKGRSAKYSEL
tara:strand:- start:301 stop:663 length:363 start_codon:yes stop_codon:yes gene_type:complete